MLQTMKAMLKQNLSNEKGHALFIVTMLSFILFMLITHMTVIYVYELRMVEAQESDLQVNALLQGALPIWYAEAVDGNEGESDGESEITNIELLDGIVVFDVDEADSTDEYWELSVHSFVPDIEDPVAQHEVDIWMEKETGDILKWTER